MSKSLKAQIAELESLVSSFVTLLDCRAGKLLLKGKRFVVTAVDEPYFMEVYAKIRKHEQEKGTWTIKDEDDYVAARKEWESYHK